VDKWGGPFAFGDTLVVTGINSEVDGLYVLRDVTNRRIKNTIDILIGKKSTLYGKWNNVKIRKYE
jgi:3D (Asp-Asp-Asp) domain-containing protein